MKQRLFIPCAIALLYCIAPSAQAQWSGVLGLSARQFTNTEYSPTGRRLVQERGWLPGLQGRVAYQVSPWTVFGEAQIHDKAIAYHGQSQFGTPIESTTLTRLTDLRVGASRMLWDAWAAFCIIESRRWSRDIQGAGMANGLQEKYQSERALFGLEGKRDMSALGLITFQTAAVFATPERMQVGFSGVFDQATLRTKKAAGLRVGASVRLRAIPRLEFRSEFDWLKISRSKEFPITRNGQFAGTVSQPEHVTKSLTLGVSYHF